MDKEIVLLQALSPPTIDVCPTGYVSDGLGNCVSPVYPVICASGNTLEIIKVHQKNQ